MRTMSAASRKARLWLTTMVVVWCSVCSLLRRFDHRPDRPEIDARIGFVVDGKFRIPGDGGCKLDLLDLAAGQFGVDGLVEKGEGADADPPEESEKPCFIFDSARHREEVPEGDPLEAGGLLKTVGDSRLGPLGDRKPRDVLSLETDDTGAHRIDPHDQLRQGGLAAPVGTGDRIKLPRLECKVESRR